MGVIRRARRMGMEMRVGETVPEMSDDINTNN